MEDNLKNFKKTYRKACAIFAFVAIAILVSLLYYVYNKDILYLPELVQCLLMMFAVALVIRLMRTAIFSRIAYAPIRKAYENAELSAAYEISKTLCEGDCYYCLPFLMTNHITILNAMGRYQELEQFYADNKKKILRYIPMMLQERAFLILTAGMKHEHIIYEQYYQRYKKRNRHMIKKGRIRKEVLNMQLQNALLHADFVQMEQLLKEYKADNKYEQLTQAYYTCKALLMQNRPKEAQDAMQFVLACSDEYAMVRDIRMQNDQTAPLSSIFLSEWIQDAEQLNKKRKRVKRIILALMSVLLLFLILGYAALNQYMHPYVNMKDAVHQVSERSAGDVYLQFDLNDVHVGLVKTYGQSKKNESFVESIASGTPIFYVTSVIESHGKISSLNMQDGTVSYKDFTIKSYAIKNTDVVYVLIQGKLNSVTYDGKPVEQVQSASISGINKKDIHIMSAFLVQDEQYSEAKLQYEIED